MSEEMRLDSSSDSTLITGIDGFTGSYLEALLEEAGYPVYGTVQGIPEKSNHFTCELTDIDSVASVVEKTAPRYVIHLAAISFLPYGTGLDIYNVNLFGALHLLEALTGLKSRPEKVILASSATVYGYREGVLDESLCPEPINHYAMSKLAMEKIAQNYFDLLPIVLARPFNYTGIGQPAHFLVPKIVHHFKERSPVLELGNLDVERDFADVRDVVRAYWTLLKSGVPREVYNICVGEATSLEQLIENARELCGLNPEIQVNPELVRPNEIKSLCGDNRKLIALGWEPEYGIKETMEWMLNNNGYRSTTMWS